MFFRGGSAEARWNGLRKGKISLRVDTEVVDRVPVQISGYQTRIDGIWRRVMMAGGSRGEVGDRLPPESRDVRRLT